MERTFNLMANPVCKVLVTENQLSAPENHVDFAAGAQVDFWGIVRASENGCEIKGIEYEAHREMAEHQLRQIAEQAAEKFPTSACYHSSPSRIYRRWGTIAFSASGNSAPRAKHSEPVNG